MKHARPDYNRFQDPALKNRALLGEGSTPIKPDEPVFLLRAQDKHAAATVAHYASLLEGDADVAPRMALVCREWADHMARWNPAVQKSPDMPEESK